MYCTLKKACSSSSEHIGNTLLADNEIPEPASYVEACVNSGLVIMTRQYETQVAHK